MAKKERSYVTVSVCKDMYVTVDEDVDLDIDTFVEGLSDEDAAKLMNALHTKLSTQSAPACGVSMDELYLALSRGEDVTELARKVLYEFGGRIA